MSTSHKVFEIHQGEWSYLTGEDPQEVLATANIAQCTVFYGGAEEGFAFMFHHDIPFRPCKKNRTKFLEKLQEHVQAGSTIYCNLTGGWHFTWSCCVRRQYSKLIIEIKDKGYKVVPLRDKFITGQELPWKNCWKKGVSFSKVDLKPAYFSRKASTKRSRSFKAIVPFFGLRLVRQSSTPNKLIQQD